MDAPAFLCVSLWWISWLVKCDLDSDTKVRMVHGTSMPLYSSYHHPSKVSLASQVLLAFAIHLPGHNNNNPANFVLRVGEDLGVNGICCVSEAHLHCEKRKRSESSANKLRAMKWKIHHQLSRTTAVKLR